MPISHTFYNYDKNKAKKKNVPPFFLLRMPKIIEIVLMVASEKHDPKP